MINTGTIDLSNKFKVKDTDRGTVIRVKVNPGSDKAGIKDFEGGYLKVDLEYSPQRGKANRELLKLLSSSLDVDKSELDILKGKKSRRKEVHVGKSFEEILRKVENF